MITSTNNNQMKRLVQLNKKAKLREEEQLFVAEGIKMFLEAPKERLLQIYVSERFLEKEENRRILADYRYEVVEQQVFSSVSDTKTPQGIIFTVKRFSYELQNLLKKKAPHFILLEDLQDPGNLGTILRTGEGAGIDGVIISKNSVDIYNPKTIRSTMGSIYRVPFLYVEDLKEVIKTLRKHSVTVYAAHLLGEQTYDTFDYKKGTAFLIGNEGNGLSEELASFADQYIKIPMEGKVESLNAAIATSILMYEVYRQRR